MNQALVVLDYATPRPRAGWRAAVIAAWLRCWNQRHHVAAAAACLIATRSISLAFDARVLLALPAHGGCGTARAGARMDLSFAGMMLSVLPLLWLIARRNRWSGRIARTSLLIAAVWWLYIRYSVYGPVPPWRW